LLNPLYSFHFYNNINCRIKSTFNLPDKNNHTGRVVGNGMTLGLTDGTNNWGSNINNNTGSPYLITATSQYGKTVGDTSTPSGFPTTYRVAGITTDPTKSGIIVEPDSELVVCIKF